MKQIAPHYEKRTLDTFTFSLNVISNLHKQFPSIAAIFLH